MERIQFCGRYNFGSSSSYELHKTFYHKLREESTTCNIESSGSNARLSIYLPIYLSIYLPTALQPLWSLATFSAS
jgi:hypothetical protein